MALAPDVSLPLTTDSRWYAGGGWWARGGVGKRRGHAVLPEAGHVHMDAHVRGACAPDDNGPSHSIAQQWPSLVAPKFKSRWLQGGYIDRRGLGLGSPQCEARRATASFSPQLHPFLSLSWSPWPPPGSCPRPPPPQPGRRTSGLTSLRASWQRSCPLALRWPTRILESF